MVWAIVERFTGVVFLLVVLPDYLKGRHLARHGVRTRAEVGAMYERYSLRRRGTLRKYDLTFTTADGTSITIRHEPDRVLEGGWEPIVYDPKHPKDLLLASEVPPNPIYVYGGIACTIFFAVFPPSVFATLG
ncbi:hypothetical protein SAMN05443665_102810 [Actinomadura meyerae]|uniref:DUF3592 domain-containing protein n=1 Tax=Actinomadura meyerae TaxID=240840 RepID=A0A239MHA7_9ACTN|nr:DUF3592 domain-containing protein [Actinomadura meyerae]SNT41328.1 hypothetical protein SAMN05443665_102810 [Actinomadura meyerae]